MPTTDERVDAYIAKSGEFAQPVLRHLRAVVHAGAPDAVETIKWGMPSFTHEGRIVAQMAAFRRIARSASGRAGPWSARTKRARARGSSAGSRA